MEKIIKLNNRDGLNIYLSEKDENKWVLNMKESPYYRQIFNEDKTLFAIDPSGGPFLSIGTEISSDEDKKLIIEKIESEKNELIITTKQK